MGDDTRSKFLLSQEALPKIAVPDRSTHEKREFALPAALREDAAVAVAPAPEAETKSPAKPDAKASAAQPAAKRDAEKPKSKAKPAAKPDQDKPPKSAATISKQPAPKPSAARDTALDEEAEAADEPRRSGASGYLIGVAAVLLIGGLGYWWTTRDKGGKPAAGKPAAGAAIEPSAKLPSAAPHDEGDSPRSVRSEAPEAPDPSDVASDDHAAPAAAEVFAATVTTKPAGATVELIGTDESGPAPMTFEGLDKASKQLVLVSHPGFMSKEVPLDPHATAPLRVTLEAKPRLIRVETIPDGAVVYVEGRHVKGKVTPLEAQISARLLRRKKFKVAIRKPGFAKLNVWVPVAEGWLEETDAIVFNLEGKLADAPPPPRRVGRRPPPPSEPPADGETPGEGGSIPEADPPIVETPPAGEPAEGVDTPDDKPEPANDSPPPAAVEETPPAAEPPSPDTP